MASLDNLTVQERRTYRKRKRHFYANYYQTTSFFETVCNTILNGHEGCVNSLLYNLKNTPSGKATQICQRYIFSKEDLYSTLYQNEKCRNFCLANNYKNWDDIISAFKIV